MERLASNEEDEAGHGICVGRQYFEVPERRPFASSSRGAGGVNMTRLYEDLYSVPSHPATFIMVDQVAVESGR